MAAPQDRAWQEGYAAGKNGKPESASPYKSGTLMAAWQKGWSAGAKAHAGGNA
jgi:ribosome modulation factor